MNSAADSSLPLCLNADDERHLETAGQQPDSAGTGSKPATPPSEAKDCPPATETPGNRSKIGQWRAKLAQGSLGRAMIHGFMTVAALTLMAKAISFFKDAAVAHRFGVSDALDAFGLAFGVHAFATSLLSGGIPAAFLPAYSQLKHNRGSHRAERLGVQTSLLHFASLCIVGLAIWICGPLIVSLLGLGFPAEKQGLSLTLLRDLIPFLICFGMTLHLSMWLRGNKEFAFAAATPILTPAAILVAILCTSADAPVSTLVWGTNIGSALHLAILLIVLIRRCPRKANWLRNCLRLHEPANALVLKGAGPFILSSLVLGGAPMVDQAMAAQLDSGSVTVLSYSDKICGIILALTAAAAAETMFPFFADAVARREWATLKQQLLHTIGIILAVAVPLVALLCWQAPLVVKLLFERGNFLPEHTARVADVLRCAALQIPFYIASLLMSRVVVSLQANWFTLATAVVSLVGNVIFNAILMRYLGVAGIALSTALVYLISCGMLTTYLLRKIRHLTRIDEAKGRATA